MAFGFPASYSTRLDTSLRSASDFRAAVRKALRALNWSVKSEGEDQITASTGWNMRSLGEKICIRFLPDNSISITSRCAMPTQIFDWSRNRKNVRAFISELQRYL